jgi:hypothetical protein
MRYHADITAGSLKVPESRIIADPLLRDCDQEAWSAALYADIGSVAPGPGAFTARGSW